MNEIVDVFSYPRLLRRVQAVLIDSIVVPIAMFFSIFISGIVGFEADLVKALALLLPIIILEPAMVSFTGGTIGHHVIKIRVRNGSVDKNINILQATIRFIVKILLGWLSLIIVLTSKRHQAIHDLSVNSIVINKNPERLSLTESLRERSIEEIGYKYPHKLLRIFMIIIYSIVVTIITGMFFDFTLSILCTSTASCTGIEEGFARVVGMGWLCAIGAVVVYGWRGRLYGCRRKKIDSNIT